MNLKKGDEIIMPSYTLFQLQAFLMREQNRFNRHRKIL